MSCGLSPKGSSLYSFYGLSPKGSSLGGLRSMDLHHEEEQPNTPCTVSGLAPRRDLSQLIPPIYMYTKTKVEHNT